MFDFMFRNYLIEPTGVSLAQKCICGIYTIHMSLFVFITKKKCNL